MLASRYKGASLFAASMAVGVDGRATAKTYGVAAPTIKENPNSKDRSKNGKTRHSSNKYQYGENNFRPHHAALSAQQTT